MKNLSLPKINKQVLGIIFLGIIMFGIGLIFPSPVFQTQTNPETTVIVPSIDSFAYVLCFTAPISNFTHAFEVYTDKYDIIRMSIDVYTSNYTIYATEDPTVYFPLVNENITLTFWYKGPELPEQSSTRVFPFFVTEFVIDDAGHHVFWLNLHDIDEPELIHIVFDFSYQRR